MNLAYLLPRVARHFLPENTVRFLLRRRLIIRPGLETRIPQDAVARYQEALAAYGVSFSGRRVMIFGYGGSFGIGCALLRAGASHVVLCDKYARPDPEANRALLAEYGDYLVVQGDQVLPRSEWMTLLPADIREVAAQGSLAPVDAVLSSSVYEHLDDVEGITRALAALTAPEGFHLHYIDLRDHFFKYPFEMLCYSSRVWYGWLNPTSNHNRYRLWNYQAAFESCFGQVDLAVLDRDEAALQKTRSRIRPEFLSGDMQMDAVTRVRAFAAKPR